MKPSQMSDVSDVPARCCGLQILLCDIVWIEFDIAKYKEQF